MDDITRILDAVEQGDSRAAEQLLPLRQRVDALLRAQAAAGSFLELPALCPASTVDAPPILEQSGTVIGHYKLLKQIGEGGMGTVWLAQQQEPVKRLVAVKLIKAGMDSKAVLARFEAERQALALMDHLNIARVFDGGTTGPLCVFPESLGNHHPVAAPAFSLDGARLATAYYGRRVDVWDTAAGMRLHALPHPGVVFCVAFGPDGRRLASGGEDKTVRVWDAEAGRVVLALRRHTGNCGCVAFGLDGRLLASAGKDRTIRLWDAAPLPGDEREESRTVAHHRDEVWNLELSPDGEKIASAGWGPAVIWDARTERVIASFGGPATVVFRVVWDPDGKRVATAGRVGGRFTVQTWDADYASNALLSGQISPPGPQGSVRFAAITDGTSNPILHAEKYARCSTPALPPVFGDGGTAWAYCTSPLFPWQPSPPMTLPGKAFQLGFALPALAARSVPNAIGPGSKFQVQPTPFLGNCDPTRAATAHTGGILVGLADGSVRTLSPGMSGTTWWTAVTPSGGEVLGSDW